MTDSSDHPSRQDLRAFARASNTGLPCFDAIRGHLESGCRDCARTVGRALAGQETAPVPVAARDAWLEPRLVQQYYGVRAGVLSDLTLACTAGPYEVEVLVREYEAKDAVEFAGQVTWADRVYEPVPGLELELVDSNTLMRIGSTQTDDLGEFVFQGTRGTACGLRLGVGPTAPCIVLWEGGA